MERCFIAAQESEFVKEYKEYINLSNEQKGFINKFFKENGIEANEYLVGGDGCVNQPFSSSRMNKITLSIKPTEKDIERFSGILTQTKRHGLRTFKKNSKLGKRIC